MNELLEPFVRMLDEIATPAAIRALEAGGPAEAIWTELAASGFLDALVGEAHGGAGLTPGDIEPLVEAIGAHALPLPVAETMVARALLAEAGLPAPDGPIALATSAAMPIPGALLASHVLVDNGEALILAPAASLVLEPTGVHGSLGARPTLPPQGPAMPRPAAGLRPIAAVLRAALIAGAAARLGQMATIHASERVQFGKPIGRQQALQQMLSVVAEDLIACRLAAQLGCAGGLDVAVASAATAKITTSTAAARIAASVHAVHGAIGIAEEYDLQLLTRRLHEWRLADGSEGYWSQVLGEARLAAAASTVDWVRAEAF